MKRPHASNYLPRTFGIGRLVVAWFPYNIGWSLRNIKKTARVADCGRLKLWWWCCE